MRILVVDPEARQLETVCRGLFVLGHEAVPAATVDGAARLLAARSGPGFDLLLADVPTPDRGTALLEVVHGMTPSLRTLIVTGSTNEADVAVLRSLGTAVLVKPFTPDELEVAVRVVAGQRGGAGH